MTEIMRTDDLVLITAVEAILKSADIDVFVADQHMSMLPRSGFMLRRILVESDRADQARRLLRDAGMESELLYG